MATTKVKLSTAPHIPLTPCESSQLSAYGYDSVKGLLAIQFKNKSGLSDVYHYSITPEQYDELSKAESKGAFFGKNLKSLDCMRLVPDEQFEAV